MAASDSIDPSVKWSDQRAGKGYARAAETDDAPLRARGAPGLCGILLAPPEVNVNSKNRIALAVAATAGVAAVALLAVLRSDTARRIESRRARARSLQRWDNEGGNIPEVSISSGEQGSTAEQDGPRT